GPISATRAPTDGRQPPTSIVRSQHFPRDSTTVPRGPLTASASARVEYVSKCQKMGTCGSCPTAVFAMIQQPSSSVRWLTGLQIWLSASWVAVTVTTKQVRAMSEQRKSCNVTECSISLGCNPTLHCTRLLGHAVGI